MGINKDILMEKILIVEDELVVALDIRSILQDLGFRITGMADSGEDAVRMVKKDKPDLVLMDIMLKGELNGIQTAEMIYSRFDIPVVYLTAFSDDPIVDKAKRSNPFGYLLKPFTTKELKITLEMALYKSKTDRQIRAVMARFRELAESITDVFFALDRDLCYVYWNKASEELTGISAKEALGKSIREISPDTAEQREIIKIYQEILETQKRRDFIFEYPLAQENRLFEIHAYPTREGLAVIAKDITEKRKMEEQLRHSQEMKLLGQLAAGVAHEVRNPLNAILVISEALFKDLGHNPEYQPYLEHIRNQVNRLAVLMKDLLELGKPVKPETFIVERLGTIFSTVAGFWAESEKGKSWRLLLQVPPEGEGRSVNTDQIRLQQIFLNILENASQNSSKGTTIEIRLQELNPEFCRIQVIDQGKGIPEIFLDRIFEPFFTTRKGGTGLGLSLVKNFMESIGGKIAIWNNTPPPGCTVELTLPLMPENEPD
jgi:PAS domain S-box-containing protein